MFGFLNCNKPPGFSSRDVVNIVQGRLKGKRIKVGHCGTLDPLAEGVLLLAVGPASRLVPFVHQTSKRYRAAFRLGAESPTGDLEVEPQVHADHPVPSRVALAEACDQLTGWIEQTPPAYSAIKVSGRRAYELARQGHDVEVPTRRVQIQDCQLCSYEYPEFTLEITCGTGTYIRTLGMDLAKAVGTVAVMTALTRTAVGQFELDHAVPVETLRNEPLESLVEPAVRGVSHLPQLVVDADQAVALGHGRPLAEIRLDRLPGGERADAIAAVSPDGHLVAIVAEKGGRLQPQRVFAQTLDAR